MKINRQHSISVDEIPHYIKDLLPVCRNDCSISEHVTSSALMIYERSQEEHPSESDAPNKPGQNKDCDASEESTTEEVAETILLRRSTRQKRFAHICVILRSGRSVTGMHEST